MNNRKGYFGKFGGMFVAPTLVPAQKELEKAFLKIHKNKKFKEKLNALLEGYVGRPSPLFQAKNYSKKYKNLNVYLKREDLNHTGAHKINNTIGQALLAKAMGKKRVIAETGAGQHGVAAATACALLEIPCEVYMGAVDVERQNLNVKRMEMLGAKVHAVEFGSKTLKDAINAALKDYEENFANTYYLIGSVVGPRPYPMIVKHFQEVIGKETKQQFIKLKGRLPDYVMACVGGGSNAIGIFSAFIGTKTKLIGVEALGRGKKLGENSATINFGSIGVLHGMKTYFLQDETGQVSDAHSIAAGLDYAGVGPEHSFLSDSKKAEYVAVSDKEALKAFFELSRSEGIIPALESAHALAYCKILNQKVKKKVNVVVCLSGRGDKDISYINAQV